VGITAPTPSALHAYDLAREFRHRGVPVVMSAPHATALPEEAARHADAVVVGEAEDTWPRVLDDARRGKLEQVYVSSRQAPLAGMPAPRWDLIAPLRAGDVPLPSHRRGRPRGCHEPDARGRVLGRQHRRAPTLREGALPGAHAAGKSGGPASAPPAAGDEELVELAARSGCKALFVRFESISQGRILTTDWSKYDGKKHCVFQPARMSPAELEAGTEWVARRFYSARSIARRLVGSRTGIWWSLPRNVGDMLAGLTNAASASESARPVSSVRRACDGPS
jgi:hypothetical protein